MELQDRGDEEQQIRLLSLATESSLLDRLHREEKRIDCLRLFQFIKCKKDNKI